MGRLRDRGHATAVLPDNELFDVLKQLKPDARSYHVWYWTPDQGEDFYSVLVDDHSVLKFAVPRGINPPTATEILESSLSSSQKGCKGIVRANLDKALQMAKAILAK